MAARSNSRTRTIRVKLKPKPHLNFEKREDFERHLLTRLQYYTAAKFLGRGKFLRYEAIEKEEVKRMASSCGVRGIFMIYAVCEYHGVMHSIHLENLEVKG